MKNSKPKWLNVGMTLWLHDSKFTVIDCSNLSSVRIESESGAQSNHNIPALFTSGYVKLTNSPDNVLPTLASPDELKRANQIAKDIERIKLSNEKVVDVTAEVSKKYNTTPRTIARWKKNYLEQGINGLIRNFDKRGGKGKKRISSEDDALIQSGIEKHYLTNTPKSMDETIRLIRSQFAAEGLKVPGVCTIRDRIKALSENTILKAQKGSSTASDTLFVSQSEHTASRPLEKVQIDHSPLDIIILSKEGREVVGKPQVTVIQDVHTRLILGIYVGLEDPSFQSVSYALKEAVFTKENLLAKYNLKNSDWPSFGLMEMLHSDNAIEFDGHQMEHFCNINLVEKQFRPIGKKEYGGLIENGIKAVMAYIHGLPGTTFSNTRERGAYDSEKKATIDLFQLRELIYRWVIKNFNQRQRDSLNGYSPLELWNQAVEKGWYPRMPKNRDTFLFSLLPYLERQITRHGISILGLKYSGPCLRHWRATEKPREKKKYKVFYDPLDMRWAYFTHPDNSGVTKIPLLSITSEHSITLEEIKAAKKKSSRYPAANADLHLAHKLESAILEEASKKNKKARKLRERRADKKASFEPKDTEADQESLTSPIDYTKVPDYATKGDNR